MPIIRSHKSFAFLMLPALLAATSLPAVAQDTAPMAAATATTPDQAQRTPAGKFVQDIGNQAIAIMADKSLTPQQRTQRYRAILQSSFDMKTIGRFVLGRAWNNATPDQQQQFMSLFEQLVLQTYGDKLNFYSGENFHVVGARQENDKDSIVSSQITHADGSTPTRIDWRVRQGGKLAVIDVVIEGISQSVTQRQEYGSILQNNNGDINALLNMMKQRLAQGEGAPQSGN